MGSKFLEGNQIVSAITPVNLATGANNGDWVNMENYGRCTVVVHKGAGTAGEDPVITLRQATDNAGTDAKALTFTAVWKKVGAQSGIGTFTKATQTAANTHTDDTSAEAEGVFVVDIVAEQLDAANGFTHLQLQIPKVGTNAQIGGALCILTEPRHAAATSLTAID